MQRFPGCLHLEPDDLNWNARLVAAATTVQGRIVPALAEVPFDAIEILAVRAGLSTAMNLDLSPSVDGAAVIGPGLTPVTANTGTTGAYAYFDGTNALGVGGITVAAGSRFAFFWPFFRVDVRNTDGVNSMTVTLHVFLHQRGFEAR